VLPMRPVPERITATVGNRGRSGGGIFVEKVLKKRFLRQKGVHAEKTEVDAIAIAHTSPQKGLREYGN